MNDNNNFDNMDERIEETVQEMKAKIDEITKSSESIKDIDLASKANEVKDKAIEVLNGVTKKLSTTAQDIKSSDDFKNVLEFVKNKSKELSEATLKKINELKEDERIKEGFNNTVNFVKDKSNELINSAKENETLRSGIERGGQALNQAKDSVNKVLENPEVSEKIDFVKEKAVDIAEKAVKVLKEWLRPELYKENKELVEEAKEEEKDNIA